MVEQFTITRSQRKRFLILIGIGVLALLGGIIAAFGSKEWAARLWSNILINNMFFTGIALSGLFFVAAHHIGFSGWHILIKRVPEAMSAFIPVAGGLMLVLVVAVLLDFTHIFHWTDPHAADHDPVLAHKTPYLNKGFWAIRFVLYFGLWWLFAKLIRKASVMEDLQGGLYWYKKAKVYCAIFLIVLAVTSSTASWDYLMSLDPHWFSTLFGWYTWASMFVAGIAFLILLVISLKKMGYLQQTSEEHLHDLGKYMFGFSVFWTYLWFCQFMLIWYANLGEETEYYHQRWENYPILFYMIFAINFFVPFLALMKRNAKRRMGNLATIAVFVLIGHWLDFYLMVTPGATHGAMHHDPDYFGIHFGLLEIGLALGYLGLFLLIVFRALGKAALVPVNHPFYGESLEHHT